MPVVVLSGLPCSGKSAAAAAVAGLCARAGVPVEVVDEHSTLRLARAAACRDAASEKLARSELMEAAQRLVSREAVLIIDAGNAIGGFRYQLWCIARGAATRFALLHVDTPEGTCRAWNSQRSAEERYPDAVFDDLVARFERPDTRNKWDRPLFTLRPLCPEDESRAALELVLAAVVQPAAASLPSAGAVAARASASTAAARELTPTLATRDAPPSVTNALHQIDRAAQDVIDRVTSAQAASASGAAGAVDLGAGAGAVDLRRPVALAELRRHKRTFLKLSTKLPLGGVRDQAAARRLFADHLAAAVDAGS